MNTIRLALAFHNHQPVGNFDGTIEECYQKSYLPFIELIARPEYESLRFSIHNSGCLAEWLERFHPEYLDQLAHLAKTGRIEVLGGPMQEPILSMLSSRDRVGQILAHSHWLERRLGVNVRGMWMPERVWEPGYVRDLVEAGMEFTILDDHHFKKAGLPQEKLYGYYLTEDDGALMAVFPDSEELRYWIPFDTIARSVDYLREIAEKEPNAVMFCADDGEKFGAWPQTFEHVYGEGQWLQRFLDVLVENSAWLKTVTMSEALDETQPVGRCYLPDCSYREMTEWAGGSWRNFKIKYPETNEMYCRTLEVSRRLEQLTRTLNETASEAERIRKTQWLNEARAELYRGQCNCPYWHGAFGGVYLPHLRNGIYRHLIVADRWLDKIASQPVTEADFNLDGKIEYRLDSPELSVWVAPEQGGMLYELDARQTGLNLLATLARRKEPYHEKMVAEIEAIKQATIQAERKNAGSTENAGENPKEDADLGNISTKAVFKQDGLERRLQYDLGVRKALHDGFYRQDVTAESLYDGVTRVERTFQDRPYLAKRNDDDSLTLSTTSTAQSFEGNTHHVTICKTLQLVGDTLNVTYRLGNLPRWETLLFGIEFNFAGLPGHCDDRYFYDAQGATLGNLSTLLNTKSTQFLGLADAWQGLRVELSVSRITDFWTHPVETVSNSEGGFELVHQAVCVVPHWYIRCENDSEWECHLRLHVRQ